MKRYKRWNEIIWYLKNRTTITTPELRDTFKISTQYAREIIKYLEDNEAITYSDTIRIKKKRGLKLVKTYKINHQHSIIMTVLEIFEQMMKEKSGSLPATAVYRSENITTPLPATEPSTSTSTLVSTLVSTLASTLLSTYNVRTGVASSENIESPAISQSAKTNDTSSIINELNQAIDKLLPPLTPIQPKRQRRSQAYWNEYKKRQQNEFREISSWE